LTDITPKSPADLLASMTEQFPGAKDVIYLDTAARGLLPVAAKMVVEQHLEDRLLGRADKVSMFAAVEEARGRFADLINADTDDIAITKNISEGLNIIATALPWEAGDNVVLCLDLEHPNNVYPWLNLRDRVGIEIKSVPGLDGHIPASALIDAIDVRTRAVSLSTVSFSPGFRTDVEPIGKACRERGVFLLADGAQSVGILHTDVEQLGLDGLAVSTQKGLLSLYGLGFLYCRRSWAERLRPASLARFGVDLGGVHEAAKGGDSYNLMAGARRFDLGNYNYPAAMACAKSLDIIAAVGTKAIEIHVTGLAHGLARGLLDLGLSVAGGVPGPHIGGIVSVGEFGSGGHDTTDDPRMDSLYKHLTENGVRLSVRQGMLRMAFHLYNTEDDMRRVLELADQWAKTA
jgi:cysteine desulfurase/selenocysteine lyase